MKKRLLFSVLFLIVSSIGNIYSQWSVDPTVNNPICTEPHTQEYPAITSDGGSGAIITWDDSRDGNFNIYAQKINSTGAVQWATDGVAVCTQTSGQSYAAITSDGIGGAVITWQDSRHGNPTIYAQRIDASGATQWTTAAEGGVAISTLSTGQWAPAITSDGSGGAIITWFFWSGTSNDIYAQRINSSGVVQWTTAAAGGVAVCTQGNHQYYPTITSDGSGGAIITWYDDRNGIYDIYAQRINSSGAVQWTANGVAVCMQASRQDNPTITFDGSGGAIITWYDGRAGNNDIYAQRIDSSGVVQWTADGVAVCTLTSGQMTPDISSDGSGGAIITWADSRTSAYDIYAQRINSSGAAQWAANGIAISTVGGKAVYPVITGDANGGIITWQDSRNVSNDIYASGVSADGNMGVLPVELTTFTINISDSKVTLNWQTATEVKNYGFEIERTSPRPSPSEGEGGEARRGWDKIGFVQGNGNSNSPKEYSFSDHPILSGSYSYRLKQLDNDGTFKYSETVEANVVQILNDFSLNQNYPNPFNPSTTIAYDIPKTSLVSISVYDILGKEIKLSANEQKNPGHYEIIFDAKELAGGIYYYSIKAGEFSQSKKMILLK